MKLIKSLILIIVSAVVFNQNCCAMQEPSTPLDVYDTSEDSRASQTPSAPDMDEMHEGPRAPQMNDHEMTQQELMDQNAIPLELRGSSAICKSCLCHLLKCSGSCCLCMVSFQSLSENLFICTTVPQERMSIETRHYCNQENIAPACCICTSLACVYTAYQLREIFYETRELTTRAANRISTLPERLAHRIEEIINWLESNQANLPIQQEHHD